MAYLHNYDLMLIFKEKLNTQKFWKQYLKKSDQNTKKMRTRYTLKKYEDKNIAHTQNRDESQV